MLVSFSFVACGGNDDPTNEVPQTPSVVKVESVSINISSLNLTEGDSQTITVTISPANATNKKYSFSSSNPEVAIVDENGKITAIKAGETTISVTTADGNKTAICKVNIKASNIIKFADAEAKRYFIMNGWDSDNDGEISYEEAAHVTTLEGINQMDIKTLDELQYFTGITSSDLLFYNCNSLTSIILPESITSIGESAFWYCNSLTSIIIPDGVTEIGNLAFEGCTNLINVILPIELKTIGVGAFGGCKNINKLTIPDGVTTIAGSAFGSCSGLKEINIPKGVTTIYRQTFSGCTNLANITIPDNVTTIGEYNQEIKGETNVEITPVSA